MRGGAGGSEVQQLHTKLCCTFLLTYPLFCEPFASLIFTVRDVEARANGETALVQRRVTELEAEVQQLRTSGGMMSMFAMPSKEDVLSGAA